MHHPQNSRFQGEVVEEFFLQKDKKSATIFYGEYKNVRRGQIRYTTAKV